MLQVCVLKLFDINFYLIPCGFCITFAIITLIFLLNLEPPLEEGEGGKEKASLELLQHDYNDLNTRKIKDSLSSFLPDIPGVCNLQSTPYISG